MWSMLKNEIEIPEGLDVSYQDEKLTVKGPKGESTKTFKYPMVKINVSGKTISVTSSAERKRPRAIMGTWSSIINNMFTGVTTSWKAKLKLVYSHFPVKLKLEGNELVIENFLGERNPRRVQIPDDLKAEIKEGEITVSGADKQRVGQLCATIEQVTKVKGYDKRVFQDGIYIVKKPYSEGENEG